MKYLISAWELLVSFLLLKIFLIWFLIISLIWPYEVYIKWVRSFIKYFFRLLLIEVRLIGTDNIKDDSTYVFMANHVSMFDIPLLLGFIPKNFWGIQASSHFKWPIYGWVLKKYGNIPIDRSNPRASYRSMMEAVEFIKQGKNIMVLPEGTRSRKPVMGEFKKLPFVMVKEAGVGIIPIAFVGLWEVNNKTSWLIKPGVVKIIFGEEIDKQLIKKLSVEELRDLTKQRIQELIDANKL